MIFWSSFSTPWRRVSMLCREEKDASEKGRSERDWERERGGCFLFEIPKGEPIKEQGEREVFALKRRKEK